MSLGDRDQAERHLISCSFAAFGDDRPSIESTTMGTGTTRIPGVMPGGAAVQHRSCKGDFEWR